MGLPEPLRASARHIELIQDKRRRLAEILVFAESQFLAALRREYETGATTWAQLRDAHGMLAAGHSPGLRARWLDAIPVSPEKVMCNAKREAAGGARAEWKGHRPLLSGEHYPPTGQCVVYVLFDANHHPIYVSNTTSCSRRFADDRARGRRWSSWIARAVDSDEAHEVQARFVRRYRAERNRPKSRA
ncbi:MAG: hypothetical protein QOC83_7179 [Pseudonocardiales bacterium]|jgi:hypothetical protein|nr:hypothetical protein [Pseudonocardiales bacterium]